MTLPVSGVCIKIEPRNQSIEDTYSAPIISHGVINIKPELVHDIDYPDGRTLKTEYTLTDNENDIVLNDRNNTKGYQTKAVEYIKYSSQVPCSKFQNLQHALNVLKTEETDTEENYINTSDEEDFDTTPYENCGNVAAPVDDTDQCTNVAVSDNTDCDPQSVLSEAATLPLTNDSDVTFADKSKVDSQSVLSEAATLPFTGDDDDDDGDVTVADKSKVDSQSVLSEAATLPLTGDDDDNVASAVKTGIHSHSVLSESAKLPTTDTDCNDASLTDCKTNSSYSRIKVKENVIKNLNINNELNTTWPKEETINKTVPEFDIEGLKDLHGQLKENKRKRTIKKSGGRNSETHSEKRYVCSVCNAVYREKSYMEKHYKQKHGGQEKTYECKICSKTLISQEGYNHHMNRHNGVRHTCKICGKDFSAKQTLKSHMELHYNTPTYTSMQYHTCDICSKMFVSKANLALHMKVHLGTQAYSCDICDVRFSRSVDLDRHTFVHTGEKPYKCKQCPKAYRGPGDLGRHVRTRHVAGYQTCKYCKRSYVRLDEFVRHLATHENDPDLESAIKKDIFSCQFCSAVLTSELNLRNHMRRHTDADNQTSELNVENMKSRHTADKPKKFLCTECDKYFSTVSNRAKHMQRKHATSDPFTCDSCDKSFRIIGDLKDHIERVHLKLKAHMCSFCGLSFSEKRYYLTHLRKKHWDQID